MWTLSEICAVSDKELENVFISILLLTNLQLYVVLVSRKEA